MGLRLGILGTECMKTVLLINSFASASQIGGSVGAFVLRRFGHRCLFIPTVLMGRHPGWGDPGMVAVTADDLRTMFEAVAAQNLLPQVDAVLTGWFKTAEQVAAATEMIDRVQAANKNAIIAVDPVMGDEGKAMYVDRQVAQAIRDHLASRAHILTPNRFEMEFLAADTFSSVDGLQMATRNLHAPEVFVTSGAIHGNWTHHLVLPEKYHALPTRRRETAPNGTGDLLASLYLAHRLSGAAPEAAFETAIHAVQYVLDMTRQLASDELALEAAQDAIVTPPTNPDQEERIC